ncbi:MAG: AAA family ATPase [Nitrospiraceae bacterium]|nr:AAA family ATPase [Nitrospiraceae bacterium]
MDARFLPHNTHLEGVKQFLQNDPHLKALRKQLLVYRSPLLKELPRYQEGIYTIGGGRQVGKTTLVKQWMADLLTGGVAPKRIAYFTGELIDDHHSLVRLITETLDEMPHTDLRFLILDEVTYIRQWDKGIKYLADAGILEKTVMVVTGSDLVFIQEARMRFPGRRGAADVVDFHLHPLSFSETVRLKNRLAPGELDQVMDSKHTPAEEVVRKLFREFNGYLLYGGFLTAMNDMAAAQCILPHTFSTYSDWIRGDVLKRGKQEHYLREVLGAVVKRYGSQVTWNALARDLSIDHPRTVADYATLLESMDALFIQAAILEDKLTAAPKKARKLIFKDPFIFHAVRAWLHPVKDPYKQHVQPLMTDPNLTSRLVEACVAVHYRRYFPTYYIKAEGEVDIAYVDQNRFWPVEIKWGAQLRPKDLKQIAKYRNGRILGKGLRSNVLRGVVVEPLPLALFRLGLRESTAATP